MVLSILCAARLSGIALAVWPLVTGAAMVCGWLYVSMFVEIRVSFGRSVRVCFCVFDDITLCTYYSVCSYEWCVG